MTLENYNVLQSGQAHLGLARLLLIPDAQDDPPSQAKRVARAWALRARPVLSPAAVAPTGAKFYRVMKLAMKFAMMSVMKFFETIVFSRRFES